MYETKYRVRLNNRSSCANWKHKLVRQELQCFKLLIRQISLVHSKITIFKVLSLPGSYWTNFKLARLTNISFQCCINRQCVKQCVKCVKCEVFILVIIWWPIINGKPYPWTQSNFVKFVRISVAELFLHLLNDCFHNPCERIYVVQLCKYVLQEINYPHPKVGFLLMDPSIVALW